MLEKKNNDKSFNTLSIEQKYAYSQTIFTFIGYIEDENISSGLMSLYDLTNKWLNISSDEVHNFFYQANQTKTPLEYLLTIQDRSILNRLLDSCRFITKQSICCQGGSEKIAQDKLNDWFSQLGFSIQEIEQIDTNTKPTFINTFNNSNKPVIISNIDSDDVNNDTHNKKKEIPVNKQKTILKLLIFITAIITDKLGLWGLLFFVGGITSYYLWSKSFGVLMILISLVYIFMSYKATKDEYINHYLDNN